MNKCIKVTMKNCSELDKFDINKILWDIRYKTSLACNKALTYMYSFAQENMDYKNKSGVNIDEKERFGKSHAAWVENRMNEIMDICNSGNVAQTRQFVSNRYKDDVKKGLFKGEVSISNFKKDIPIIIHNKNYKIMQGNNGYEVEVGLFNREYQSENNIKRIVFNIDKLDGNEKATLNKIINGVYKQGSAQIIEDKKKKGKWYLIISFGFEIEESNVLNNNRILGVDLGITNTATMSIWDEEVKDWLKLSWKERIVDGSELIHYRQKIEARNKQMCIASKWAGEGRVGHGYNTRMKPLENTRGKVANFRDTYNHKISKYIVQMALKYNCGIIQMEDLSGFSELQSESLLKNWSYYDLQTKVKYKAEEAGIQVIFIDPKYTSKRCRKCGCIHVDNRNCKENQGKFECKVCGYGNDGRVNADINASMNIALPDIENIIKNTEVQGIETKVKDNSKVKGKKLNKAS